jgi:hypothetical protein
MRKIRRTVLVVACALALAGCSSGGGGDGGGSVDVAKNPTAAMKAAAKRTADADSVQMTLTIGGGESKVGTGSGAFDFKKNLGRFKLDTTLGLKFDLVLAGDDAYMRNPSKVEGAKPWLLLKQQAESGDPVASFVTQLRNQIDPRETLRYLDTLVSDVKLIGSATIRGEQTQHVRGRIDLSEEAIAKTPASMHNQLRQAQSTFGRDGYAVDVWLDGEGRVRRFEFVTGAAGASPTTSKVTMDLFAYGEDPKITVPKASDVQEQQLNTTTTAP